MKTSDVLRAAKARIDTPARWCNNGPFADYERSADLLPVCMLGGIGIVTTERPERTAAIEALTRAVGTYVGVWNDAPGRTHAEVMEMYDRAIADAEAAEQEFTVAPVEELVTV